MSRKILLLNPPGPAGLARDAFLGGRLEADFVAPPIDLACLSASLPNEELSVLDAPAEGLDAKAALARVAKLAPDAVVALSSGASFAEDGAFLAELRRALPGARVAGLGDVYRDLKEPAFELHPALDAILLDYWSGSAARWLAGEKGPLPNVIVRGQARGPERRPFGTWKLGAPRWELFPLEKYRWPFAASARRASILTEYGCPFLCGYCPDAALGSARRPLEEVLAEWRGLAKLGVGDVLVRDATFGSDRPRTLELLRALRREKAKLSWTASTRVDLAEPELLEAMREAGCVGVGFGVDSGDDEVLRAYKKTTTRGQAEAAVKAARAAGLKVWGQFVVGFAMDTRESAEATLELARSLELDWVTVRAEVQRYAADYRREMLVRGLVPPEAMPPDTPTSISVWHGRLGLSNQDAFSYVERAARGAACHEGS